MRAAGEWHILNSRSQSSLESLVNAVCGAARRRGGDERSGGRSGDVSVRSGDGDPKGGEGTERTTQPGAGAGMSAAPDTATKDGVAQRAATKQTRPRGKKGEGHTGNKRKRKHGGDGAT